MAEDINVNEVPEVNVVHKLLGLLVNGELVSITANDLLKHTLATKGDVLQSIDDYTDTGLYGINRDNFKTGVIDYGLLIVFNASETAFGGNPILQIAFGINGDVKYRMKWYINNWNSWRTVSFT